MITKAMLRQVQAFRRQGFSKASIVKALDIDPKTVAKYFAREEAGYRAYRQEHLSRDKLFKGYGGGVGGNRKGANNGNSGVMRKELSPRLSPYFRSSGVS